MSRKEPAWEVKLRKAISRASRKSGLGGTTNSAIVILRQFCACCDMAVIENGLCDVGATSLARVLNYNARLTTLNLASVCCVRIFVAPVSRACAHVSIAAPATMTIT